MKYSVVKADETWFRENINCQQACPAHTPASNYIERLQEGDYEGALQLNYMANLFPHVLGRVCTHPCEAACRRGAIDRPVAICTLKRVAADFSDQSVRPKKPANIKNTGKKIAIIGAGPSGLAAANDLALLGHSVTVFEALPMAGGMLSVGIPPYRLPWHKIESAVKWVEELGIDIKLNSPVKDEEELDTLIKDYDAVYLAAGAHKSPALRIPGEDLSGVVHGIKFMKDLNLGLQKEVPQKVAVVGGGFTAIDCARSSLRLGAKEVSIIYRRTLKEMPAGELEVSMAEEEAIKILYLTTPVKVLGDMNGRVKVIECLKNRLGEPDDSGRRRPEPIEGSEFTVPVDMVVAAIGQSADMSFASEGLGVKMTKWGSIEVDPETLMSDREGLFVGGDYLTGPRNVIEVIADGRKVAKAVDDYLGVSKERKVSYFFADKLPVRNSVNYDDVPRQKQQALSLDVRWDVDKEVELGFDRSDAQKEADRCLLCHYNIFIDDQKCVLCGGCIDICPHNCIMMISREKIESEGVVEGVTSDDWDA
ncbi:MAG: FAD-dependent oxidoreductase, partial [Planctomycetes bacterium]|nr:FAD-dependent oxidoreductase [Planctomycetota bacterium]